MKPASESALLVCAVAVLSDSRHAVASSIVGRDLQIRTNNGLPKHVFHSLHITLVKLYPLNQGQGILRIGKIRCLRPETIKRHTSDTTRPFFVERICDLRRGLVVINDDVEKAIAANDLNCGTVAFVDFDQLCKGPVDAIQIISLCDTSYCGNPTTRIAV